MRQRIFIYLFYGYPAVGDFIDGLRVIQYDRETLELGTTLGNRIVAGFGSLYLSRDCEPKNTVERMELVLKPFDADYFAALLT